MSMVFKDREEAGRRLAERLAPLRDEQPVVLALPRGGVPVAAEVARALGAPLDVIVVRKLGVPFQRELGFGAIGEGGVCILDADLVRRAGLTDRDIASVRADEEQELARRVQLYRGDWPPIPISGRTVVIIDDGLATGSTAHAAIQVARAHGARRIVLAVPVAPPETVRELGAVADEVICLETPPDFEAVGRWYRNFTQTSDDEVAEALRRDVVTDPDPAQRPGIDREVVIPIDGVSLEGHLAVPERAIGVVLFAHGSGSSRHSPRNQSVARALFERGLGSLLFDLLTPEESDDRRNVFDIELLGERLLGATEWIGEQTNVGKLPCGYLGASTGGGAALWAAAAPGNNVRAVVSRGGRPDLAGPRLADVRCPTLLIVGGADREVLELNRAAAAHLRCHHYVAIVPRATHLFEEPGTLEEVAGLAGDWFEEFLPIGSPN